MGVGRDEAVPGDGVSVRDLIEHLAGIGKIGLSGVKGDEGVGEVQVTGEAILDEGEV